MKLMYKVDKSEKQLPIITIKTDKSSSGMVIASKKKTGIVAALLKKQVKISNFYISMQP